MQGISKRLAQQIVEDIKNVCDQDVNFISPAGIIFASTDPDRIGNYHEIGHKAAQSLEVIEVKESEAYEGTLPGVNIPLLHNRVLTAVIGISGAPEYTRKYARMAERIARLFLREQELQMRNRSEAGQKAHIIDCLLSGKEMDRNYLLDYLKGVSILPDDRLQVLIIKLTPGYKTCTLALIEPEILNFFQKAEIKLYAFFYPDKYLAVMNGQFERHAARFMAFAEKYRGSLHLAVGSHENLYHLVKSGETADAALSALPGVRSPIAVYEDLDIQMLLSCIDRHTRENYLKKVVSRLTGDDLSLLKIYYEENQSLTKTCSRLYLHKNSLQYRLNRIKENCGYDPRTFCDGVILYLALQLS